MPEIAIPAINPIHAPALFTRLTTIPAGRPYILVFSSQPVFHCTVRFDANSAPRVATVSSKQILSNPDKQSLWQYFMRDLCFWHYNQCPESGRLTRRRIEHTRKRLWATPFLT